MPCTRRRSPTRSACSSTRRSSSGNSCRWCTLSAADWRPRRSPCFARHRRAGAACIALDVAWPICRALIARSHSQTQSHTDRQRALTHPLLASRRSHAHNSRARHAPQSCSNALADSLARIVPARAATMTFLVAPRGDAAACAARARRRAQARAPDARRTRKSRDFEADAKSVRGHVNCFLLHLYRSPAYADCETLISSCPMPGAQFQLRGGLRSEPCTRSAGSARRVLRMPPSAAAHHQRSIRLARRGRSFSRSPFSASPRAVLRAARKNRTPQKLFLLSLVICCTTVGSNPVPHQY